MLRGRFRIENRDRVQPTKAFDYEKTLVDPFAGPSLTILADQSTCAVGWPRDKHRPGCLVRAGHPGAKRDLTAVGRNGRVANPTPNIGGDRCFRARPQISREDRRLAEPDGYVRECAEVTRGG